MDLARFRSGMGLFNRGNFFDAHEVWEDVWREAPMPEKQFLQGLIQIAVAFHHYSTGNLVGAQSLLARGVKNLNAGDLGSSGVELARFLAMIEPWQAALTEGKARPPMPQLKLRKE